MAWAPVSAPDPAVEPVTLAQARAQCQLLADDTDFDVALQLYIAAARAYCEMRCGTLFAVRDVALRCDSFADLAVLPVAPVEDVIEIGYTDPAGVAQTIDPAAYELRDVGGVYAVALKPGHSWPVKAPDSVILVEVEAGGSAPADVRHAMLLHIADSFAQRENSKQDDWSTVDRLLFNHIRYF